ncbi:YggS family pyridoxal phosphate-dependent enzyme [Arenibacter sp. GZD96]|uniref:YggS family pyridoxal phosphate-dependent enzyme n=1 Tax=Aurantibrevibacter litoralis TaxID=3106030 RepID=UPI002AFEF68A|nr:YggS family pyridoxal phosphate-dependent enzyme [Arenibacter sp. GZD-96]MEA1786360.1 YggS family pyridoxal phosphate-dependent enzyme [Arenibacter sp. GZD-96]
MSVATQLAQVKESIPPWVHLVAVSKTKPISVLQEAYDAGQRIFGENRVQEMVEKWEALPKDIQWHMIGHVQTNKIKYMASFVTLIHGVDSLKVLLAIDKQAKKHRRIIPCLLQIHIAAEETKFGFDEDELLKIIDSETFKALRHVQIKGLMGMATFTENKDQIRREFKGLKALYARIAKRLPEVEILSMGMSGDYQIAIAEGSTMVRIGSSIFGDRTL